MDTQQREQYCEAEHTKLMKIINFRFPNQFKRIGLVTAVIIFAILILTKFVGSADVIIKDFLRTLMLVFLLLASLSKDKFEDEYIIHVRSQSYVIAFVCAIAYSICIPLIAFVLDILITNIRGEGTINFHETSAFEVIFMLICFQMLFFEVLKRFGRAQ